MFRTSTVLVVGAGASSELDFPLGAGLLKQIAADLTFRGDFDKLASGSERVMAVLRSLTPANREGVKQMMVAAREIVASAGVSLSIDNVLYQKSHIKGADVIGKIAIAARISAAERKSSLQVQSDGSATLRQPEKVWLHGFAQALVTDHNATTIERCFDKLTIINFNYDRSLEAYLPEPLIAAVGMSRLEAQELIRSKCRIYHPYGMIGDLPGPNVDYQVRYGEASNDDLVRAVDRIRTFGESQSDSKLSNAIKAAVGNAEQIIFAGFGFFPQNMDLLKPMHRMNAKVIRATTYTQPDPVVRAAREAAYKASGFPPTNNDGPSLDFAGLSCVDFFQQYHQLICS